MLSFWPKTRSRTNLDHENGKDVVSRRRPSVVGQEVLADQIQQMGLAPIGEDLTKKDVVCMKIQGNACYTDSSWIRLLIFDMFAALSVTIATTIAPHTVFARSTAL